MGRVERVAAYDDMYGWSATLFDVQECLKDLAVEGLQTDGAHHKQWFLERILEGLGCNLASLRDRSIDWEDGVAP